MASMSMKKIDWILSATFLYSTSVSTVAYPFRKASQ